MSFRDLSLCSPYTGVRRIIPQRAQEWTQHELDELRASLERRDGLGPGERRAWDSMERERLSRLEQMTAYPSATAPHDKVLATMPIEWRASRAMYRDPCIALLSHRIDQVINSIMEASGSASKAEGRRIYNAVHGWNLRVLSSAPVHGAMLPGGLRIYVMEDRIRISHLEQSADAPAAPGQLSRIRLLISLWRRLATRVVAKRLSLCTDAYPQAGSTLYFALRSPSLQDPKAFVAKGDRVDIVSVQTPLGQGDYQLAERLKVARTLTRYANLDHAPNLVSAIAAAFSDLPGRVIRSLDVAYTPVGIDDLDDAARHLIQPQRNGAPVRWDDEADSYVVLQGASYPQPIATFTALDTAIEFERSNRDESIGLRLAVG